MDEIQLKNRIKETFPTLAASADLVERTVQRGKAIRMGREAETLIESGKGSDETIACAVAGRLMVLKDMPKEMSAEEIRASVMKLPAFSAFCAKPCDQQLESLRNGTFLSQLTLAKTSKTEAVEKKPPKEVNGPQL